MRRFALVVGIVVALGLGGAPSAVAAEPGVNHFTITESFTDGDFCGTGQAVDVSISIRGTEFLSPNQPVGYRNVSQGNVVYTNPQNDTTVIRHFAGPVSDTIISGDPQGVNTHELIVSGLSGQVRTMRRQRPAGRGLHRLPRGLQRRRIRQQRDHRQQGTSPQPRERPRPVLRRRDGRIGAELAAALDPTSWAAGATTTSDPAGAFRIARRSASVVDSPLEGLIGDAVTTPAECCRRTESGRSAVRDRP